MENRAPDSGVINDLECSASRFMRRVQDHWKVEFYRNLRKPFENRGALPSHRIETGAFAVVGQTGLADGADALPALANHCDGFLEVGVGKIERLWMKPQRCEHESRMVLRQCEHFAIRCRAHARYDHRLDTRRTGPLDYFVRVVILVSVKMDMAIDHHCLSRNAIACSGTLTAARGSLSPFSGILQ